MYEACERLAGPDAEALLAGLVASPAVPVSPHADAPLVVDAMRRAPKRAGYDPTALGLDAPGTPDA